MYDPSDIFLPISYHLLGSVEIIPNTSVYKSN